jgi:hypothetical protein
MHAAIHKTKLPSTYPNFGLSIFLIVDHGKGKLFMLRPASLIMDGPYFGRPFG